MAALDRSNYSVGPIHATGAVTVDFSIPANLPPDQVVAAIERDRLHMAKRPGLRQKHLPLRFDSDSGNVLSGGRYLFETFENAVHYKAWVEKEFILDGTMFFQRLYFLNPVCHVWQVISADDFTDIHSTHVVIRSERWRLPPGRHKLEQAWPQIYAEAKRRGLSSVWLLHNEPDQLAGLVSIANRVARGNLQQPDIVSLQALESAPSLGMRFDQQGWTKVFDRTSWVLTIWFPIAEGKPNVLPRWPNSPPLPAPAYALAAL